MKDPKIRAFNSYGRAEETANAVTHGIGALLSVPALILLIIKALEHPQAKYFWATLIYGISMLFLYTASTLYHSVQKPRYRNPLNVMDHLAIYLLIAGTYTPYAVLVLGGITGRIIFGIVWGAALTGIILKLFFFGKYNTLSAIAYVLMGWVIVVVVKPLYLSLGWQGTALLFAGGLFYTLGAVLYLLRKIPFNHAIFHLFVLLGSLMHFLSVYYYVL